MKDLNQIPLMTVTNKTIRIMKDIAAAAQQLEGIYAKQSSPSQSKDLIDSLETELNHHVENLYELAV